MKHRKRLSALVLSLLTVGLLLSVSALAVGRIDQSKPVRLTLSYQEAGVPLVGAAFSAYQIATVNAVGELTTTEPFQSFNVDIRGKNDAAWRLLASTLEGYLLRDNVTPTAQGVTDEDGQLTWPAEGKALPQGLYLILGERHTQDGYAYDPTPFLVLLPSVDKEQNEYRYEVTADVKHQSEPIPDTPKPVTRTVQKVWKDTGHESERPQQVVVQLLQNGEIYDTVTLSAQTNWRHTWTKLDGSAKWNVTERDLSDYTVTVSQETTTFVVTNTYQGTAPSTPTNSGKLPQTGQLWWPVPVLLSVGLLCVLIGALRRRGAGDEP